MKLFSKIAALFLLFAAFGLSASDAWMRDFSAAQEKAKKENKVVLMLFSGTDWCPPCMALEKNILSKKEFLKGAEKSSVLMLVDFAKRKKLSDAEKKQRETLAGTYKVNSFPTLIVVAPDGKELKRSVGAPARDVNGLLAWLSSALPKK